MVFIHNRRGRSEQISDNTVKESYSPQNSILNPNVATCIVGSHQLNNGVNVIKNYDFSEGLKEWEVTTGENGYVVPKEGDYLEDILPYSGINYAIITRRPDVYQGLEQNITESLKHDDITGRLRHDVQYKFSTWVRVHNVSPNADGKAKVKAILRLEYSGKHAMHPDLVDLIRWPELVSARASTSTWTKLERTFSLRDFHQDKSPQVVESLESVVFKLEGPDKDIDLLIDSVLISHSSAV